MPVFATPEPVTVALDLTIGEVRVTATDRDDTGVEVRPGSPAAPADVKAAAEVRVRLTDGRLTVDTPRRRTWRPSWIAHTPTVIVEIGLPAGSDLRGRLGYGELTTRGPLGRIDLDSDYADADVADVADVRIDSSGTIRLGRIRAGGTVVNKFGATTVDRADGDLRVEATYGTVDVGDAPPALRVTTAYGAVRVGRLRTGTAELTSSYGDLEVGVADGTAVWLDAATTHGRIRSDLTSTDGPGTADDTLELTVRTTYGQVRLRRV